MFRCTRCLGPSLKGEPAVRVVVETRPKVYPIRSKANRPDSQGYRNDDRGGNGYETVREILVHSYCV